MKKRFVKICPKCGSREIKFSRTPLVGYLGFQTPNTCRNCGFSSLFFPEVDEKEAKKVKVKKNLRSREDQEIIYKKAFVWYILIILIMAISVYLLSYLIS